MWIRLTRKLADFLDGVDVSDRHVGDVFELPTRDAQLLIAEQWAQPYITEHEGDAAAPQQRRLHRAELLAIENVRRLREAVNRRHAVEQERRRIEDRIREELRDSRATTIRGSPDD